MVFIRHPEQYLADPETYPFINTPVERVKSNLRNLPQNRRSLNELGKQGRRYIETSAYGPLPASRPGV
jgi:hypothetical protein